MKGTKLCLLGISIVLAGIAVSTYNFWAIAAAVVGIIFTITGLCVKD